MDEIAKKREKKLTKSPSNGRNHVQHVFFLAIVRMKIKKRTTRMEIKWDEDGAQATYKELFANGKVKTSFICAEIVCTQIKQQQ